MAEIPEGVTFDQLSAISAEALAIRRNLGIAEPVLSLADRIEYDVNLVASFYNPNHDHRGRFSTGTGGGARGGSSDGASGAKSFKRTSTKAERLKAKQARTEELVAKWGEEFRPSVDSMLSWMDEFTPAEAEARRKLLADAVDSHPDTHTLNTVDGKYTPERAAKHAALIAEYQEKVKWDQIPANREALLSGGLGGAGKGTMLEAMGIDEHNYITIDPDAVKGLMVKHGLVPNPKTLGLGDFDPPIRPLELAGHIHEESSQLSKQIASMATKEGKNVILDNTMGSDAVFRKVEDLKSKGYGVDGVFVDVSVDMSTESALARHMNGTVRGGLGGRFVDPKLSAAQAPKDKKYRSANAERFDSIKTKLNKSVVIDNEAYRARPSMFSVSAWKSFSPEARRYILRNVREKSMSELLAHVNTMA